MFVFLFFHLPFRQEKQNGMISLYSNDFVGISKCNDVANETNREQETNVENVLKEKNSLDNIINVKRRKK